MMYPRTYHTSRADATYEQCSWDLQHVEGLYPILRGHILPDGQWHRFPASVPGVAQYRIRAGRLQVVYAAGGNEVVEQLLAMEPLETEDDAEWEIWKLDGVEGFAVSSTFATTAGPFEHDAGVNEWLSRHALGLNAAFNDRFVEGVAYFERIDAGCLTDAIRRLAWLEEAFRELVVLLQTTAQNFWEGVEDASNCIVNQLGDAYDPTLIAPLPDEYLTEGAKRRLPISLTEE
jgi:hypothetical protein